MTDNSAELKARTEEKKQEVEQIIKRQRSEILTPKVVLGLLNFDVAVIVATSAIGSLTFYMRYFRTAKIALYLSITLFLIVPVGFIWYWRVLFPRTIGKQKLLDRIKQSAVTRALARFGNNRWVRIWNFCYFAVVIVLNIRSFAMHPRLSLGMIVFYLAISFVLWVSWATEILGRQIDKRINGILDVLVSVIEMVDYALNLGESSFKYIVDTEPSRSEADKANADALIKINESLKTIWEFVRKYVHAENDENEPIKTDGK